MCNDTCNGVKIKNNISGKNKYSKKIKIKIGGKIKI